ncbi:MAG: PilZ domain-containing protein [Hahellaceae bacterium]|nr:PilZ domain-containing protein [Hahellaceae bacterium]MCP5168842.1 PilZ domain-containing protein [Hahellaceae bacterium]
MTEKGGQERRQFSRITFDAGCTLHHGEEHWDTEVLDISMKGVLLKRPDDFIKYDDKTYEVTIKLTEDGEAIVMSIRLAHEESTLLGFHCDYIDIDSITHLRRLVELNLGDGDLLNRELVALSHDQPLQ